MLRLRLYPGRCLPLSVDVSARDGLAHRAKARQRFSQIREWQRVPGFRLAGRPFQGLESLLDPIPGLPTRGWAAFAVVPLPPRCPELATESRWFLASTSLRLSRHKRVISPFHRLQHTSTATRDGYILREPVLAAAGNPHPSGQQPAVPAPIHTQRVVTPPAPIGPEPRACQESVSNCVHIACWNLGSAPKSNSAITGSLPAYVYGHRAYS